MGTCPFPRVHSALCIFTNGTDVSFMTKMGKRTPGSALHYTWEHAGDVIEVDPVHVLDLRLASHGDIYEIIASPEPELVVDETATDTPFDATPSSLGEALDVASVTKAKRPPTRRK